MVHWPKLDCYTTIRWPARKIACHSCLHGSFDIFLRRSTKASEPVLMCLMPKRTFVVKSRRRCCFSPISFFLFVYGLNWFFVSSFGSSLCPLHMTFHNRSDEIREMLSYVEKCWANTNVAANDRYIFLGVAYIASCSTIWINIPHCESIRCIYAKWKQNHPNRS